MEIENGPDAPNTPFQAPGPVKKEESMTQAVLQQEASQ
jgi:hypothetical protein